MEENTNAENSLPSHVTVSSVGANCEIHYDTSLHSQFMTALDNMRRQHLFTDVTLCAGHEEFPCHRAILVASSPYFEAMFRPPFDEGVHGRVTIQEISPWTVKRILDYIYTGKVELTQTNVEDLLGAASRLQYPRLLQSCTAFMLKQLDVSNCLGMELLAHFYGLHNSAKVARKYAEENFSRVVEESTEWLNVNADDVCRYLALDEIDVKSEEVVFNSVMRWTLHDVDNRHKFVLQMLQLVRLPHLSENFLKRQVQENKLIKDTPGCVELLQQAIAIRRSAHLNVNEHSSQSTAELDDDDNVDSSKSNSNSSSSDTTATSSCCTVTQPTHYSCPPPRPSTFKRPMLVALGGINAYILNSVEVFDPQKSQWSTTAIPPMPLGCTWFGVCSLDNDIYVTGGIKDGGIEAQVYRFCSEKCNWLRCADMPIARARHCCVAANDQLYVFGGITTSNNIADPRSTHAASSNFIGVAIIHRYDPQKDEWFTAGEASHPRKESVIVAVNDPDYMVNIRGSLAARERLDCPSGYNKAAKKRSDKLSAHHSAVAAADRLTLIEIGGEPVEFRSLSTTTSSSATTTEGLEPDHPQYDNNNTGGGGGGGNGSPSARHASWEAHVQQQQQQMAIYRIQQTDQSVVATQDYILLPKRIHHAKCVTRQMGTMLYILWESSGDFAVLNLTRNSIVFLSPLPSPSNDAPLISNPGSSSFTSSHTAVHRRPGGGVLHCGMACVQEHIYVVGGCRDASWQMDNYGSHCSADVLCFDPQTNNWSRLEQGLSQPRGVLACVAMSL